MKLIIDIPNEAYNRLLAEQHLPNRLDIEYFIVHGKPFDELITEIKTDLKNATDQAETSQEDIDCGIEIGLQMAIDVVNKYGGDRMHECFHCGARAVIWDNDYDFSDCGEDGEGIIHECHCMNCGARITYRISTDNEEEE